MRWILFFLILITIISFCGCTQKDTGKFWEHMQKAESYIAKSGELREEIIAAQESKNFDRAEELLTEKLKYDELAIKELKEASKNIDNSKLKEFTDYMKKSVELMKQSDEKLSEVIKMSRAGDLNKASAYLEEANEYKNKAEDMLIKARTLDWIDEAGK